MREQARIARETDRNFFTVAFSKRIGLRPAFGPERE
jgi:hypothetical protein